MQKYCDLMASNSVTARQIIHRIWIARKSSLIKRAKGLYIFGAESWLRSFREVADSRMWNIENREGMCFKNVIWIDYTIQIKICAEYRDMLPRPRLVCQEPGLRPIGRSPGVPDKSSRGLGSMSRYSAQILICFIAYIFLIFFLSSVGLVGNFAGLPVCTVPSAIVHCNQNEAGHQAIKAPSMPCWDAAGPSKHSLAFKSQPGENDR